MSSQTFDDAVRDRYRRAAASAAGDERPVSFGAGDLLRHAALEPGEVVLDLGCGTGVDVIEGAARVGASGRVVGVDMLPEMCVEAARNTRGLGNVSIREADMAALPLPDGCVDVVVSNCVINLARDKARVIGEAHRVLAPGGRLVIVDTAFAAEPSADVRADTTAWSCCVGGAMTIDTYRRVVEDAGFEGVSVTDLGEFDASRVSDADVRSVLVAAHRRGGDSRPVIRPAVRDDLPAIEALLAAEGLPGGGFDVDSAAVLLGGHGVVEGVVMLERFSGEVSFLRSLVVAPPARGRGHGRRLVEAALQMSVASGGHDTFLLTPDARDFFGRFGFEPERTSIARAVCPSSEFDEVCCSDATAMRLRHQQVPESSSCCPPG
jgi:SAM-dependent methyltransferase